MYLIKHEIFKALSITVVSLVVVFNSAYVIAGKAEDSSTLRPPGTAHMVYQSYVSNDCITTDRKSWDVVLGYGSGSLDQNCPADHPHMVAYNQSAAFTGMGFMSGGNLDSTARCCALAYHWVNTPT
jgi:hypothetical protein